MRKKESARSGQKICTETAPDKSSHKLNSEQALMGKKMGGGTSNLSHSIGSSANMGYQSGGKSGKKGKMNY